ncbi:hypothetical protein [Antarctobacter sp.]|uniref:hypothetical protein n=1 Tax=Antarctobacter sp. TaxID=1872577 RepID=UPI002B26B921|nr:hypothetical protein [Antarctobacter sp.]
MIEIMLFARFAIMELRLATDTPTFILDTLDDDKQIAWIDDFANRVQWPVSDAPSAYLLDSGVNPAHNLIEPSIAANKQDAVVRSRAVDD